MAYEKVFTPLYEDGWEDLPSESTPITAQALDNYDEAIENIEDYLENNPIENANANLADEYDNTQTYAVGDYVIYNGTLYKCTTAVAVAEDFDSTKWTAVLVTDEMSSGGGSSTLAGLTDTNITTPTDGQFLVYNSTSQKWENVTVPNAESEGF